MKNIFRNREGALQLIRIWLIGIAVYVAIDALLARLYLLALTSAWDVGFVEPVRVAFSDLLFRLPISALEITALAILHRKLLDEPLHLKLRPLLLACGAMLAAITAAVLLLVAAGRLRIVSALDGWAANYGEFILTTAIYALITISIALATAIFRYCFLCGSALKRLNRWAALAICFLLFGLRAVLAGSGGVIAKLNDALSVALYLLALDVGGVGACCGVVLGQCLGLAVLFGSQNSAYVLMRLVPASDVIAPTVHDLLTGGSAGLPDGLWLTGVLVAMIVLTMLCDAGMRAKLRAFLKCALDSRMGA